MIVRLSIPILRREGWLTRGDDNRTGRRTLASIFRSAMATAATDESRRGAGRQQQPQQQRGVVEHLTLRGFFVALRLVALHLVTTAAAGWGGRVTGAEQAAVLLQQAGARAVNCLNCACAAAPE